MNEDFEGLDARLAAIQYMVVQLYRMHYEAVSAPDDWVAASHAKIRSAFKPKRTDETGAADGSNPENQVEYWINDILEGIENLRFQYRDAASRQTEPDAAN